MELEGPNKAAFGAKSGHAHQTDFQLKCCRDPWQSDTLLHPQVNDSHALMSVRSGWSPTEKYLRSPRWTCIRRGESGANCLRAAVARTPCRKDRFYRWNWHQTRVIWRRKMVSPSDNFRVDARVKIAVYTGNRAILGLHFWQSWV